MAESGSNLSGSSAVETTTIDRGERFDDGDDASNERELGSTGGRGVGERVEVRSCGRRPCGNKNVIVAISAALDCFLSTVTLLLLLFYIFKNDTCANSTCTRLEVHKIAVTTRVHIYTAVPVSYPVYLLTWCRKYRLPGIQQYSNWHLHL